MYFLVFGEAESYVGVCYFITQCKMFIQGPRLAAIDFQK